MARVIGKKPPAAATAAPACAALFDKYFRVKMLWLHSRDTNDLRKFGTRISGIEEIDRNRDKEEIITELSVDMMFEQHRKGVTVKLMRYEDAAEVYRIIQTHILAWAEYLDRGINTAGAPIQDLIELDMFAAVVYDKAVNVFSELERKTALSSNYLGIQGLNFNNILKRAPKNNDVTHIRNGVEVTKVSEAPNNGIRERHSYKELFSEHVRNVAEWNKS